MKAFSDVYRPHNLRKIPPHTLALLALSPCRVHRSCAYLMSTDVLSNYETLRRRSTANEPAALARDEAFWTAVAAEFAAPSDFVHLEYGYYHPCCRAVLETQIAALHHGRRFASHYKRTQFSADYEAARTDLARVADADPEEIVITRNATEALNIVIHGLPLERGDEVVLSDQDYESMNEAWQQRAQRDGLVLRRVALPLDPASDTEIVDRFAAAFTSRTRALHLTHLINFTGQLLPAAKLCALARSRNIATVVDAAHSFAHIDFTVADLDCDYLGASLHKWLAAPLGTGLLYVKRERIPALSPLFGDTHRAAIDIRKLEHFGNRPDSAHLGLREAIRWHHAFGGTAAKHARLHALQRHWTDAVRSLPRVRLLTPSDPARHGAIGTFAIEGLQPATVVARLMNEHGIFANAFDAPIQGVRITPGLHTSRAHIDRLVSALEALSRPSTP